MILALMTPSVVLIVIGAGVLHATWNAIAKQLDDRLVAFALIGVAATAGGGITLAFTGLPFRTALPFAFGSAAVHVAYQIGLMGSYRVGAFNQTYPIARGTSPLVVALGAYVFAHEHLSTLALSGVLALAAGLMSLALSSGRLTSRELPAVGIALLTGLTIATYTLLDGLGVRRAHDPYAYAALIFLLQGPALAVAGLMSRPAYTWRQVSVVSRGLLAGVLSLVAYGAVLWAQTRAPLAEVAALRETSVVAAAVIGTMFFRERFGGRRVAAAVLVAAGIIMIAT